MTRRKNMLLDYKHYLDEYKKGLDSVNKDAVETLFRHIVSIYQEERTIYIIGNGGSASNASHFCQDLSKNTILDPYRQKRIKVISLTDNISAITAWANDSDYSQIFVEQLRTLAYKDDMLIAISGSGNSPNILRAVEYANHIDMLTIGMTGRDGGQLGHQVDLHLNVPIDDMGLIEATHLFIIHYLINSMFYEMTEIIKR